MIQTTDADRAYHNPYNFVPTPSRATVAGELGDRPPVGHHRYEDGHYSGRLSVRLRVITPLLLPDAAHAPPDEHDHRRYPVRLDATNRPHLPPTSVKGMLRAAYEAVTNSRLGVFAGHDAPLGYRPSTGSGATALPAQVTADGGHVQLFLGTSRIRDNGAPAGPLLYAAWLPRYPDGRAVRLADGPPPPHGQAVVAWIELFEHYRWNRRERRHVWDFDYWRVLAVARSDQEFAQKCPRPQPSRPVAPPREGSYSTAKRNGQIRRAVGYVVVTNRNIGNKHDERLFFHWQQPIDPLPIGEGHKAAWRTLIADYQATNAQALSKRREPPDAYLGHEPGKTAWSAHVYQERLRELRPGTFCYAQLKRGRTGWEVDRLTPVMISRELYPASPADLLDESLRPATSVDRLSPNDRVFGWVRQPAPGERHTGPSAYRGNLRIGPIACLTDDAVEYLGEDGLPLAILGEPKPQQARFYLGDQQGRAQPDRIAKAQAGYAAGKQLRGRKVYPHHGGLPKGYWDAPLEDRTQQGGPFFQEYRRPRAVNGTEQRDDQNRSIKGWVRPGTTFAFDCWVTNLSLVELGALLWLLQLPPGHHHRLGGGKPLGFGSVRLELASVDLRDGAAWRQRYRQLADIRPASDPGLAARAARAFTEEVTARYGAGGDLGTVPFIAAFLQAARGFADGNPTHYPRGRGPQDPRSQHVPLHPDGLGYEWFVENEREDRRQVVHGLSLPELDGDTGLPYFSVQRRRPRGHP